MSKPPRFVTCPCQHCGGGIEFDANQLDPAENVTVPCPHCRRETKIFVPEQQVPTVVAEENVPLSRAGENENDKSANETPPPNLPLGFQRKHKSFGNNFPKSKRPANWELGYGTLLVCSAIIACVILSVLGSKVTGDFDVADCLMWLGAISFLGGILLLGVSAYKNIKAGKEMARWMALARRDVRIPIHQVESDVRKEMAWRMALASPATVSASPETNESRTISSKVRREVWRRDGGKCVKCGSRKNLEYDHIVPFSKGGGNTARNIELLCETCNRTKSASIQ